MAILIRSGLIHTMTEKGVITGDILLSGDRIIGVEDHIDAPRSTDTTVLEASGMHVIPGMIDAGIHACDCDIDYLAVQASHAGITNGLVMHEDNGMCSLLQSQNARTCRVLRLIPESMTDSQLYQHFNEAAQNGIRILCSICDQDQCGRILAASARNGVKLLCDGVPDSKPVFQAIADARHGVILGRRNTEGESTWNTVVTLTQMGVECAISTQYPGMKLILLPICAGLCRRAGLPSEVALRSITQTPAKLLGIEREGCICPGFRANIAIFNGDPCLLASSLLMTISGGCIHRRYSYDTPLRN